MSEWKKVKLGEIASSIQTGPFGSQLHQSDYSDEGTPVVMPKDIINGHIDETTIARVEKHHVDRLVRHKITEGDIIYARRGDVGKCAYIVYNQNGWLCGTGCLKVTIDRAKAIPKFVFFQLQKRETIGWVEKHAIGATMLNLNTSILSEVPIELPSLLIQNRVVEILSRYDTLIENYQKQIKLLEEAAQRLYKEWFVDFRFPGYENVKMVDGLPEGWERKTLGEVVTKSIGGGWGKETPQEKYDREGYVIRGTDISKLKNGSLNEIPFRYHTESNLKERTLSDGDIIFEVSGGSEKEPVGRMYLITQPILDYYSKDVICASFCKKVSFTNKMISVLCYFAMQHCRNTGDMKKFEKDSAGNIINFAWTTFLQNFHVLLPNNEVLNAFYRRVNAIINSEVKLSLQIRLLTEARDRLLPRLMRGEMEV